MERVEAAAHRVPVAARTLLDVLPRSTEVRVEVGSGIRVAVGGHLLRVGWADAGSLRQVQGLVTEEPGRYDVVTARRLSPAARELLSEAGIGWADQTGAAEVATAGLTVSRSGRPPVPDRTLRWTPAATAVVEALLCGVTPTVAATRTATGLSTGAVTGALRALTEQGLLVADAARGRRSARRIADADRLLERYSDAVDRARRPVGLPVGLHGRDLVVALAAVGSAWDAAGVRWAATGSAAAAVLAPTLTDVSAVEVYVDAVTPAGLEARAADAGLRPIEGGRLTLRPFPTAAVAGLAERHGGIRVAPWPRVYADLRRTGVRGEVAAERLREVTGG